MEYKDERSEDLRLHLFRGELELAAFPVLERRRMRVGGLFVDASIIGASHAVQIGVGSETITEVLACRVAAVDMYADRLEGAWPIDETVRMQPAPGLGYAFACEVRPLGPSRAMVEQFHALVDGANGRTAVGLKFRFPQRTVEPPETLLYVTADEGALSIRSLHVYPGEEVGVFSETRLAFTEAAGMDAARELVEVGRR